MNPIACIYPLALLVATGNIGAPHKVLKFECSACHSSSAWQEVKFDHARTGFELEYRHAKVKCAGCHSLEDFKSAGSDCIDCHEDIHQGKLARSYEHCHTAQGWTVFNRLTAHANTSFPLLGAHASLDCDACHTSEIEGEYSFLKSECVGCHQADFERAASPSHTQMNFGSQCENCHFPASWRPANFSQHDSYFPVFSGRHAGVWNSCDIYHSSPQNYKLFSCFGCHEHSRSRMDGAYGEVRGYTYDSNACYSCHPNGSGGG